MNSTIPRPTQDEINRSFLDVDHLKHGIGDRTARGGAIVMTSQLIRLFLQLAGTFVLARLLTPADFGLVAIGMTVMAFMALFTELGLSTVTVQTKNLDQDTASALFYFNIALALAALGVTALLGPFLVAVFHDERVPLIVVALAACTPITALGAQHAALLTRNMRWIPLQVIGVGAILIGTIAAVLSVWLLDLGYWALVVQSVVTALAGTIAIWIYCPWRPSAVRNWSGVWRGVRMSLNLSGTTALAFLHRQADNILIGWRWGATELGYYTRAYGLLMMPLNLVTGPLTSAIVPALSRLQDEPEKWRRAYLDGLIVVTALGGALAAVMFGAGEAVIEIVLGPNWERAEQVFTFLVLAMLAATPMNTVVWIYVSLGRTFRMLQWGVIGATAYVAAFFIGLPYGAPGVALAYSTAQSLAFLPCLWMATRQTSVTLVDVLKACLPITALTVLIGGSLRIATGYTTLWVDVLLAAMAGLAYLGGLAVIGLFWAPHTRVRDRGLALLRKARTRLSARGGDESAGETINIAMAFDTEYAAHAAGVAASAARHCRSGDSLRFLILQSGIDLATRARVEASAPAARFDWIEISDEMFPELADRGYINRTTLYRLGLEKLAPKDCERLIYLDADLTVCGDLGELWRSDLQGRPIGAVIDPGVDSAAFADKWGLKGDFGYFNAGVLLIDLAEVRRRGLFSAALKFQTENGPELPFSDQDSLNWAAHGAWRQLDPSWNVQRLMVFELVDGHERTRRPPARIVHFTTWEKPWLPQSWHPWAWIYWDNLARTPFLNDVARRHQFGAWKRARLWVTWLKRGPRPAERRALST